MMQIWRGWGEGHLQDRSVPVTVTVPLGGGGACDSKGVIAWGAWKTESQAPRCLFHPRGCGGPGICIFIGVLLPGHIATHSIPFQLSFLPKSQPLA